MAAAAVGETLARFSKSRQLLRDVYSSSKVHFDQLRDVLRDDFIRAEIEYDGENNFLSPNDVLNLEKVIGRDPVIIVSGQVNSGKTSLINELLGGSYLPTSAIPCTARVVQIMYSDVNYLQVFDADQNPKMPRYEFSSKKVPEDKIALDFESRADATEVECLVRVGLNNELLRNGIQLMDIPGLSENESLDNLVSRCLDGMLQLVVYVIDGKTSLRSQDTEFLYHLKTTSPNAQILFVCNKIEDDQEALEMDRFSDDSGSDEERPDRAKLAFMKLKRAQLLPSDSVYRTDLENYHGLSCTQIRKNRLKKTNENEFSKSFDRFKVSLLNTFAGCVNSHLSKAVIGLLQCQRRLFDFGIAEKITRLPRMELRKHVNFIINQETGFHRQLLYNIRKNWHSMTFHELQRALEEQSDTILEAVQRLEFQPITLDDKSGATQVIDMCRLQVRDYVLALVIESFEKRLKLLEMWLSEEAENVRKGIKHDTFTGTDSGVESILQNHLAQVWGREEIRLDMTSLKDVWVSGLCVSVKAKLKQLHEDLKLRMGGIYLDEKWKKKTAEAVLRNINLESLATYIIQGVENRLNKDHQDFLFAMRQIENLCKLKETQAQDSKKLLKEMIPSYSKNLCVTEALATTLKYGVVCPQQKFAEGSRCEIFECSEYKNEQNLVVKKTITDPEEPPGEFCPTLCYTRLMTPIKEHSTVVAVAFDSLWQFCIVQKKYGKNLFEVLSSKHNLSLEDRLSICQKVATACDYACKHGIRLNDLRPNNIFIEQNEPGNETTQEEVVSVVLNIHKWKDLNAPYPDGKPPFHFAPELAMSQKAKEKNFETYSLTVLLVQLVLGRIVRPPFSESEAAHKELQQSDNYVHALRTQFVELWEQNWEERESRVFKMMKNLIKKYIGCEPADRVGLQIFLNDIKRFKSTMNDTEPDPSSSDNAESMEESYGEPVSSDQVHPSVLSTLEQAESKSLASEFAVGEQTAAPVAQTIGVFHQSSEPERKAKRSDRMSPKRKETSASSSPASSSRSQTSSTQAESSKGQTSPSRAQRSLNAGQVSPKSGQWSQLSGQKSPASRQWSPLGLISPKWGQRSSDKLSANNSNELSPNNTGQVGATQFYPQGGLGPRSLSADPGLPPRPKPGPSSAPHAPYPGQARKLETGGRSPGREAGSSRDKGREETDSSGGQGREETDSSGGQGREFYTYVD